MRMSVSTGFRVRRKWGPQRMGFLNGGWGAMDTVSMGISHLCSEPKGQSSLPFFLRQGQEGPETVTWVTREFRLGMSPGDSLVGGAGRLGMGIGGRFM